MHLSLFGDLKDIAMTKTYQLIGLNCRFSHSCLALYYVRYALEHQLPGCRTDIHQLTINDPYYDLLMKVSALKADALFISVYVWNARYVERLVGDLAAANPQRPIILGGPQTTSLEDLPPVCTVVVGEIEGVGEKFFDDLQDGNLQPRYEALPVNSFPFPYRNDDFTATLRDRLVYYESSRGCPFRCSYCLSSAGQKVARKDVDVVKKELASILMHEPKIIKFVDRTFNDNLERALEIWRFLSAQPGNTLYHFEIAPDRFSEEMFGFLETVQTDRFQFEIGIQSTNPETLEAIHRTMDIDTAVENISRLVRLDSIHLHVDLILGLPFDTRETFLAAFSRVFFLQPHYIQMGLLKILPDTPISHKVQEFNIVHCRQPPYEILANRWLNHQKMGNLYYFCECVEAFYNNRYFRTLWNHLKASEENISLFFTNLLSVCEEHRFFDLAHTQELLTKMLSLIAEKRVDRDLVMDILRFDWLRCGHRFLPSFLEKRSLADTRAAMRQALPPSMPGEYDTKDRNEYIKRGVFLELAPEVLSITNLSQSKKSEIVCFLPEQTTGVTKHNRVACLEGVL